MWATFSARLSAIVFILSLGSTSVAYGEAFRVLGQGNSGTAQGDAFAAQADDPSAIFYNPAGMTQLQKVQFSTGVLFIGGHYDYKNPDGQKFRGDLDGPVAINPPPATIYVTANLSDLGKKFGIDSIGKSTFIEKFNLGLGMNSPFGLVIRWPKDVPFSSVTTFAQLPLVDIKPTVAFKFNEYFSVGAGLDIYTFIGFLGDGKVRTKSFIPPGTNIELDGKDTALGFNVGFLLTPWRTRINDAEKPRLNLAFVYRSRATLDLSGDFRINGQKAAGADFDLKLPQIFTWGAAVWPIRDESHEWKLETDLDYVDWSSFKNLNIRLSNGMILPEPRDWKDIVTVKLGTEFKWLEIPNFHHWEVAVRGGYIRANSPVPERTFEPRVPNSNFNGFSFGIGLLCKGSAMFIGWFPCKNSSTEAIGVDLIYKNQLYVSRTIRNNINPVVNGTYNTRLHAGGIGLRVNF
jgi:long-chain fatty acid transport protein